MSTSTEEDISEKAQADFVRLMRRVAPLREYPVVLDLQPPYDDSGETDCWTHSWKVAHARGGRYMEGVCYRGNGRISAHAWVEVDSPLGTQIIETTPGYEQAYAYRGLPVKMTGKDAEMGWYEGLRFSLVQLALSVGMPVERVLA